MSAPAWLAALGLVNATGVWGDYELTPSDDSRAFDAAPVLQWSIALPGPAVPSASHAELGSPLIYGESIYVGYAGDDALLVLDRRNGALLDRLPTGAPVRSKPVVDNDLIYFSDAAGVTWCYELGSDTPLWSHEGTAPVLATPTVLDGRVFVSNVANVLVALDANTGELAWRHAQRLDPGRTTELELYGSPSPLPLGDLLLAGFSDGTLTALDRAGGEVVWQRRVGEGQYPDVISAPLPLGGDVVVAGYTEPLVSIDLETRNVRWRLDFGGAQPPVAGGGVGDNPDASFGPDVNHRFVYHGGVDGLLRCIDGITGAVVWEWDSETESALTRPVQTDAGLLVGSSGGGLYLVNPVSGALDWAWRPNLTLEGITAAPEVKGRQAVVVTNAGYLVSFVAPLPSSDRGRSGDVRVRAAGLGR